MSTKAQEILDEDDGDDEDVNDDEEERRDLGSLHGVFGEALYVDFARCQFSYGQRDEHVRVAQHVEAALVVYLHEGAGYLELNGFRVRQ